MANQDPLSSQMAGLIPLYFHPKEVPQMEIKKILVPVDGSDASKRAFKMAVDVAKVHGAELVVTCIADVSEAAYPIMGVTLDKNGFINIKAKAERLLAALKEEIPSSSTMKRS